MGLTPPETLKSALGVGLLGGLHDISTFDFDTHAWFENGAWLAATTNMFASPFIGLAVRAGIVLAKSWLR